MTNLALRTAAPEPVPVVSNADLRKLLRPCDGSRDFIDRRDLAMIRVLLDTGIRGRRAGRDVNRSG